MVRLACVDVAGRRSERRIEPPGLLVQPPAWYLLARDLDRGEPRTFCMDRVSAPRLLAQVSFRPAPAVVAANLPAGVDRQPLGS